MLKHGETAISETLIDIYITLPDYKAKWFYKKKVFLEYSLQQP